MQEMPNQSEEEVLVLPSVATAGQLLNSKATSGKESNHGNLNIKAAAQSTARVEEIFLFDPPSVICDIGLIWCSQKPNCISLIFALYFNLVNFNNFWLFLVSFLI